MKKKEVSMTELFFDLIFVYVLATINQTVEGISHNIMSLEELGKSFMLFLVFFSIWIYRTLLVNRFFNQKWYQYIFVFIDMYLIVILSKAINSDFQQTFLPFVLIFLVLSDGHVLLYIHPRGSSNTSTITPTSLSIPLTWYQGQEVLS